MGLLSKFNFGKKKNGKADASASATVAKQAGTRASAPVPQPQVQRKPSPAPPAPARVPTAPQPAQPAAPRPAPPPVPKPAPAPPPPQTANMTSTSSITQPPAGGIPANALAAHHAKMAAKYKWLKDLNEGAFGAVHLALNTETNERVAIKKIPRGDEISKYIEREILNQRLCGLHPHIVKFKEVFLTDKYVQIVMEYAEGGDLFDYVAKRGRITEDDARWFFQQMIFGVDFCHKKGIQNRDIKLENILLDGTKPRPLVKICDFGYSKNDNVDSIAKSAVGTPEYIAPEVLTEQTYDGKTADVWSCGVMLYVMLTGSYPFEASNGDDDTARVKKMLPRMLSGKFKLPKTISPEGIDLLTKMLNPNPATRLKVGDVMRHPWYTKGLPTQALTLNEDLLSLPLPATQSEEEIAAILNEARGSQGKPKGAVFEDMDLNEMIEQELEQLDMQIGGN